MATTRNEERVRIPCGGAHLSAILTRPTVESNGIAIIFYAGRWSVTSIGRSRLFVHMARQLAGAGFHSLRLDLLGLGESTGEEREWQLDRPFIEEPDAAVRWLRDQGLSEFMLMGTCGGARLALSSAERVEGLRGVVLFAPPVRDFRKGDRTSTLPTTEFVKRALTKRVLAGLGKASTRRRYLHHLRRKLGRIVGRRRAGGDGAQQFEWVTPNVVEPLKALAQRGVPVLFFFGKDDSYYAEFERGLAGGRLATVFERAGGLIKLVVVEGRFHGLPQAVAQRQAMEAVEEWLPTVPGCRPAADLQPQAAGDDVALDIGRA